MALPRCQRRFSRPFAPMRATFRNTWRRVQGLNLRGHIMCRPRFSKPAHCHSANPPKFWCPVRDSNPQHLASKASATTNCTNGAFLVDWDGFEPSRNLPTTGLQPGALPFGRPIHIGGPCRIRTCNNLLLRKPRLPIAPMARKRVIGIGVAITRNGGRGRTRTDDRRLQRPPLYQLSYAPSVSVED